MIKALAIVGLLLLVGCAIYDLTFGGSGTNDSSPQTFTPTNPTLQRETIRNCYQYVCNEGTLYGNTCYHDTQPKTEAVCLTFTDDLNFIPENTLTTFERIKLELLSLRNYVFQKIGIYEVTP